MRDEITGVDRPDARTLVVSVDKAGHLNQCLALCDMLKWSVGSTVRIPAAARTTPLGQKLVLNWRRFWATRRAVPASRLGSPIVVVASGVASETVVRAYRKLYGEDLFAVLVGSPKSSKRLFDVAIASYHATNGSPLDYPGSAHTFWISGVLAAPLPRGASEAKQAVLIGGTNKAFRLDAAILIPQLQQLASSGQAAGLVTEVAFSRRTPAGLEQDIRSVLTQAGARFIDRTDRHGYLNTLATSSKVISTPDSISMVCEARAAGNPVQLLQVPCIDPESTTARFVADSLRRGIVSYIGQAAPLSTLADDGVTAAKERLIALYGSWRSRYEAAANDSLT